MSLTTRCSPLTDPGSMSVIGPIPVPKTIAHAEPGYVLVLKMKPARAAKVCVSLDGDTGSILGGSRSAGCSSS